MAPKLSLPPRTPRLPLVLQRRSTDEYSPLPYHPFNLPIAMRVRAEGPKQAARLSMSLADYWSDRQGTAAALSALNDTWGSGSYNVPPEAALDRAAADEALGGDQLVIDVQTHYVGDSVARSTGTELPKIFLELGELVAGNLVKGLDKLAQTQAQALYSFSEYLRCVFLESETAVAVLTSAPGAEGKDKSALLTNAEMIGTLGAD